MQNKVILASQSPRRKQLLGYLFSAFSVLAPDVDERLPDGIPPGDAVEMLAKRKALAAFDITGGGNLIIAADTVVCIQGKILGKPQDTAHAKEMLQMLSGKDHQVYTGVTVYADEQAVSFHECTAVSFCALGDTEIDWYVSTGEPMDKAGSYGIQGYGSRYIRGIQGDYFNVMGLPVNALYQNLKAAGLWESI